MHVKLQKSMLSLTMFYQHNQQISLDGVSIVKKQEKAEVVLFYVFSMKIFIWKWKGSGNTT